MPNPPSEVLTRTADIAKQVEAELTTAQARRYAALTRLRALVEGYLGELAFTPEARGARGGAPLSARVGRQAVRPVLSSPSPKRPALLPRTRCLPRGRGQFRAHVLARPRRPAALDDDDERRGRPSAHVAFGEATALLAGDACSRRRSGSRSRIRRPRSAGRLAQATLAMIGSQHRDVTGDTGDLASLHRLKTGALFSGAVGVGLRVAAVPDAEQAAWRAFGERGTGPLFQFVDDLLDGDGSAEAYGIEDAPSGRRGRRPRAVAVGLDPGGRPVLAEIVADLAARATWASPVEQRVSLITLGVRDLARARAFYEALQLDLTGAGPDDDVVFFQAGGMIDALREGQVSPTVALTTPGPGEVSPWPTTCVHDRSGQGAGRGRARPSARQSRVGAETFWGGYSGVFVDPDGHPWEVAHNAGRSRTTARSRLAS